MKIIKTVTVTGADDSVEPVDLLALAKEFSYVEFGILLSKKQQGSKRFPSLDWLRKLAVIAQTNRLNLSGHICGRWVRDLCRGEKTFFDEVGIETKIFNRLQLNFHAEAHLVDASKMIKALKDNFAGLIILQMDGVNDLLLKVLISGGIKIEPLFDLSSGAGILPESWPKQLPGIYCGYAGGLSPDNLAEQMTKIATVATEPIWIDAETLLRSNNDKIFDLDKVRRFLAAAEPFVIK